MCMLDFYLNISKTHQSSLERVLTQQYFKLTRQMVILTACMEGKDVLLISRKRGTEVCLYSKAVPSIMYS